MGGVKPDALINYVLGLFDLIWQADLPGCISHVVGAMLNVYVFAR